MTTPATTTTATAADYHDELETMFLKLPGWLQDPLREPFNIIDGLLQDVAGKPDELMQTAAKYTALGGQISQLAAEQQSDREALFGLWTGTANDMFSELMPEVETRIDGLGKDVSSTSNLLAAAAQACAEGANAILDIVWGLISYFLTSLVVNAVFAVLTLGGALVAEAVAAVGRAMVAVKDVIQVAEKTSSVIEKVATTLEKIEQAVRKFQEAMAALLRGLDKSGNLSKELNLRSWLNFEKPGTVLKLAEEEAAKVGITPAEEEEAAAAVKYGYSSGGKMSVKDALNWAKANGKKFSPTKPTNAPAWLLALDSGRSAQDDASQAENDATVDS